MASVAAPAPSAAPVAAAPVAVAEPTADAAPASMIKKYGAHNGFGWKLNEVIGAQIVNVPMAIPIARADATFNAFMIILGAVFATIWLLR